ncbi:hypothetical protein EW145_g1683 [Phellinidium pouzarii]|uniref:Chloride channel protein n=1 Tax=Phellinidium pouzarii TaxID=167371 RepID=A0A4V3XDJ2_9AGAM|nr:hypothetical protein EW145_g1683 [Phellinidium pouzarii]
MEYNAVRYNDFESWDDHWRTSEIHREEEQYELRDDHALLDASTRMNNRKKPAYADGSTIDWLQEEAEERSRLHHLRSLRGLRGLLLPLLDSSRVWFIVVITGIGVGITGAWLDILVHWLSDLREGRCAYGFFYNQVVCCSGLDSGEVCTEWLTWSQWFGIRSILGQSMLQAFIYITLAIVFSSSAALLVLTYAPYAFHTGIPEIKAILGGYVLDEFLGPWTLLIKSLGLVLAVASGLSLGKEGPLVHVACCMIFLVSKLFKKHLPNEAQKRRLLAAAASAGISVAFGSPLGGVLFGLEELDTSANDSDVMWRGFVTSVIAAVSLQYIDPFGTSKLVLFQVTSVSDTWRAFELVPWLTLSIIGGVLGSFLIKLNVAAAVYRQRSYLHNYPILEVVCATAVTGCISYLIVFMRVQTSELVANLFQECDPSKGDYHGLCNPNALYENIFLLILTAIIKLCLTAVTFGMMVPAGIFLPTIAMGACLGRAMGLFVQGLHRAYPALWIFSTCPPDPTERCVSPGFYAIIGASAMLGGVTRMTISLVVILFELTGALSHVLPIMISVMVSKWVGDAFGKEGIYSRWIALRRYPWLPYVEYRDNGETAANIMVSFERLITIDAHRSTLQDLAKLVEEHDYHGYPAITPDKELIGYITRLKLKAAIDPLLSSLPDMYSRQTFTFVKEMASGSEPLSDLSELVDQAAIQLRKETPQELVVTMFQKMNMRYVFLTRFGSGRSVTSVRESLLSTRYIGHWSSTTEGLTRLSISKMSYQDEEDAYVNGNLDFLNPARSGMRRVSSGQSVKGRKSSTSLRGGPSLAQTLDDDAGHGMHSLAHELAVALMPEPSTDSKMLQEEFGIEFDEGAEGIDEQTDLSSEQGKSFIEELNGHGDSVLDSQLPSFAMEPPEVVLAAHFGTSATPNKRLTKQEVTQDPMDILAKDLESTDKFLAQLRQLDVDSGHSSSQPSIEKFASDIIRHINETVRDREGQVRELLEYEREFRKIAGDINGNDVLGQLDPLKEVGGLSDKAVSTDATRSDGRSLDVVLEDSRAHQRIYSNDWEMNPDDHLLGDDDVFDEEPESPTPMKDSFAALPSFSGPPTVPKIIPHVIHVRTLTRSLATSLTAISEHAQVNGAASADAGRKIRALKNKLSGWRSEWDSAELSRIKIERWEAGLPDDDSLVIGTSPRLNGKRIDARRVVEEHLKAFEVALADAGTKTQAIMARS